MKEKNFTWEDRKTGLYWERFNPNKKRDFDDYNELVNIWSSDREIRTYMHFDGAIADVFEELLSTDEENIESFFYCFDNNNLAGVVYIAGPSEDYDETNIEYIIVNPRMRGQGIGTRMISSIKSNPTFFAEGHRGKLVASIENSNTASQKAFLKNGFKKYVPISLESMKMLGLLNKPLKFGRWSYSEEVEKDK